MISSRVWLLLWACASISYQLVLVPSGVESAKGKLELSVPTVDEFEQSPQQPMGNQSSNRSLKSSQGRNYEHGVLSVNITVTDAPKLVGLLDELNIPEETNATITCSVGSGNLKGLTYEWYKDEELLHDGTNPDKIFIVTPKDNYQSTLRVINLEPSDGALYSCIAKNRFGQDKISTKLNVKIQLKWIEQPKDSVVVSAGKSVRIPCQASGVPPPQIEWYKLEGAKRENLGPSLRFMSVEPENSGTYECRASNGVEEDLTAQVKLDVLVTDTPKLVGLLDELNIPEETNATITCSVGSGNLNGLTFEWYKDEELVHEGANRGKILILTPPDNFQSTLRVFNLEPSDGATYSCIAKNRFGQDKISTKLNVKIQLKWIEQPKDSVVVSAGKSVRIPCQASGVPPPQIEWYKLEGAKRENLGPSLRFMSVEPENSGTYECRASNGVEEDLTAQVKLNVLVSQSPKIVDSVDRLNHPEGTNATFTCSIGSGDLQGLTLEWFRDDRRIAPSPKYKINILPENVISTLRVLNLTPEDSGVYSCVAKNAYGQDRISTKLNVKVQLKWMSKPTGAMDVPVGKHLHVPCVASGQPMPKIEWTKLTEGQSGESRVFGSELRFDAIGQDDSGLYECRASNGAEKDLASRIRLNVLGK